MMKTKLTFLVLLILFSWCSDALCQSTKVMSFNIRFDNPADGINSWDNRKEFVVQALENESPDIIGMQEVLERQASFIKSNMDGYDFVGVGRDDGKSGGEYSPVFYKADRFEVGDWGTFWLSSTPSDTGSVGWDAALTRICTWARFKDHRDNREFYFLNTHFDHIGQSARRESAKLILQFIEGISPDIPVILTGDFNCVPEDGSYQVLTNPAEGLEDACFHGASAEYCDQGTFNGFGKSESPERIDLILFKGNWEVKSFEMLKLKQGEMFISDHWPVLTEINH